MQAAHHARMEPVIGGDALDRLVGALDAGIEEDEQIDAADGDDPEEEEAERTELRHRVESGTEQAVERPLDELESAPEHAANGADHRPLRGALVGRSGMPGAPPFAQEQAA